MVWRTEAGRARRSQLIIRDRMMSIFKTLFFFPSSLQGFAGLKENLE
jgi:hypothetical protein